MDLKAFKIYRNSEGQDKIIRFNPSRSRSSNSDVASDILFSLNNLMDKDLSFLTDKVFELVFTNQSSNNFKYVVIKMKKFSRKNKFLIQIIDMSDKMLYNEIKAEKSFLALINAAVSHELRNPLSSLIG
jgi:hypothetical protein